MKIAANIAGGLLGLAFIAFALMFFLDLMPKQPKPVAGSPAALFMGAFVPTHYLTFVKVCELIGGILVAIPFTRNFGLLVLGPILVNILAFHVFIVGMASVLDPVLIFLCLLAVFLLWTARKNFSALRN